MDDSERATEKRRNNRRRRRGRLDHPDLIKVRDRLHGTGYGRGNRQPGGAGLWRTGLSPVNLDDGRIRVGQIDIGLGRKGELGSGNIEGLADAVNIGNNQFDLAIERGALFDAQIQAWRNASRRTGGLGLRLRWGPHRYASKCSGDRWRRILRLEPISGQIRQLQGWHLGTESCHKMPLEASADFTLERL